MSKPEGALEMEDHHDLTAWSLVKAINIIIESDDYLNIGNKGHSLLKVASQNVAACPPLMLIDDFSIEVDFNYDPDEWSYHVSYFKDHKLYTYIVWSPGA